MTDLAPRPPKRTGANASTRNRSETPLDAASTSTSSRRNPLVIRGALVVLLVGLVVSGWAFWRHTVEAAYADRGVSTIGSLVGASVLPKSGDVLYTDLEGRLHEVAYRDLGARRFAPRNGTVPVEFLADDPETVRYDRGSRSLVIEYLVAGLVVGFGLFGLYIGTYFGTPIDRSASRKP